MKSKLLSNNNNVKNYAVIFDEGDEVIQGLEKFAKDKNLSASSFTAVGAFSKVTLGYFMLDQQEYKHIPIEEQVEVLALLGDITLSNNEPKIHAHVVVGKQDGTAHGGHVLKAFVRPTLEVIITETPAHLQRKMVPKYGIPLIDADI